MKERLVEFLACPDCHADLSLVAETADGGEVVEGTLACTACTRRYPITRGVPRLLPSGLEPLAEAVAAGFGWQWETFDEIRPEYRRQFLDWMAPLQPEDFCGRRVLEGGCGKGRHTALMADFGATDVFAVDLGSAVEAAWRNVGRLPAVHVIQGDVTRLPLKRVSDLAVSVGVIHHLPEPILGVRGLGDHVVAGGKVAIWVYGREGNEWIVHLVNPVREGVTSRLPRSALYQLSRPLGALVAAVSKGVYKPLAALAPAVHERLFYRKYLTYIADLPDREIHAIVFDQLVTPVAFYMRREEVEALFDAERFADLAIDRHNGNSWRAHARVRAAAEVVERAATSRAG